MTHFTLLATRLSLGQRHANFVADALTAQALGVPGPAPPRHGSMHRQPRGRGQRTPASARRGRAGPSKWLSPQLEELRRALIALPPGDPSMAALRRLLTTESGGPTLAPPIADAAIDVPGEQLLAIEPVATETTLADIATDLFGSLDEPIRVLAIQRYLSNDRHPHRGRMPEDLDHVIPSFYEPVASIARFNNIFPLGRQFHRWKDGVRIYTSCKSSRTHIDRRTDTTSRKLVAALLSANIIEPSRAGPFVSNFFYVVKDSSSTTAVRPIVNYSHLSPFIKVPKLVLPSLFQIARKKLWSSNLMYVKLDFKQAFFNIPIHPKARHITTFFYGGQYFRFTKMPFGISLAPYVCQRFLSEILAYIKKFTPFTWGHIDDILIAHENGEYLKKIVNSVIEKCALAGWEINTKKSVFEPATRIRFLGAIWGNKAIWRDTATSTLLLEIWRHIRVRTLKGKVLQRVRGFFLYYLSFAGNFFSVMNRILLRPDKYRYDDEFLELLARNSLPLNTCKATSVAHFASDATLNQLASVSMGRTNNVHKIVRHHSKSIILNEILAAFLSFPLFRVLNLSSDVKLVLHVDNMAAVAFLNKGRANYASMSIRAHYQLLTKLHNVSHNISYHATYIHTAVNPADALSRKSFVTFPMHVWCNYCIIVLECSLTLYIRVFSFFSTSVRARSFSYNKIGHVVHNYACVLNNSLHKA